MPQEMRKPKILRAVAWQASDALDKLEMEIQDEYVEGVLRAEGGHQLVYNSEKCRWIASQLMVPVWPS